MPCPSKLSILFVSALLLPGAYADDPQVRGPISGLVFDAASGAIRPIQGFPGAALVGDAIFSGLDRAEIAPDGKSALALQEGSLYRVDGLDGAAPASTPIAATLRAIDRMVWNGDSSAALLYSAGEHRLVVTGPDIQELDLSGLSGDVSALLLARSGVAVVATEQGVYQVSRGAPAKLLAPGIHAAAMAFVKGERDLVVADTASLQILQIQDFNGAAAVTPFAGLPQGQTAPVAMTFSADGRFLFLADAAAKRVSVYDFASQAQLTQLAVDSAPAFLRPLAGNYFLLNSGGPGEPVFVLDTGQNPTVYFVPARRQE